MLVTDIVHHAAERYAGREAVVCGTYRLTYALLIERASRLVSGLYHLGYKPGDRMAIISLNCHRAIELYVAAAISGLVIVPMKVTYSVDELQEMVQDTEPSLIIANARDAEKIHEVASVLPRVRLIWWDDDGRDEACSYAMGGGEYEWLIRHHQPCEISFSLNENSLFALVHTTGSTDRQKAVMVTQRTQVEAVVSEFSEFCFPVGTYVQSGSLLFSSGAGMIVQTILTGGKQVLLNGNIAEHILRVIEEERADGARYLPQLVHTPNLDRYNVSSLKYVIQGGYHLNPYHFQTFIERFGPILIHGYGTTETGGIASLTPDQYWRDGTFDDQYIRSCGHALPGVTIRIVDEHGKVLPPGEAGEVLVHTRALMPGYWRNSAAAEQAIGDGWYHTHDIGLLDESAYLFLLARNETPSGTPTYEALDVDTVLSRHESVADSATFARPTPDGRRNIVAIVEPRPGMLLEVDALMAYCRCRLAENDRPLEIHVIDCMPRNTSGKILRRNLREHYVCDEPAPSVMSGKAR